MVIISALSPTETCTYYSSLATTVGEHLNYSRIRSKHYDASEAPTPTMREPSENQPLRPLSSYYSTEGKNIRWSRPDTATRGPPKSGSPTCGNHRCNRTHPSRGVVGSSSPEEPLVPLSAQAVQNLIGLLNDQARSLDDYNARRINNEGNATVVRANTAPDLRKSRPRSPPLKTVASSLQPKVFKVSS